MSTIHESQNSRQSLPLPFDDDDDDGESPLMMVMMMMIAMIVLRIERTMIKMIVLMIMKWNRPGAQYCLTNKQLKTDFVTI